MVEVMSFIGKQPIYLEAHISDIHFGVIDPVQQYKILYEQFILPLHGMKTLDIISINGDLFDHKFMANSDAVLYAAYFMNNLVQICRQKNATLILIGGTASHDADQLKMFAPYLQDPSVDFRLVTNDVKFEFVKGKKILCVPELYGKTRAYYENFLFNQGPYDACYMHGTFAGSIPNQDIPCLETGREPVFGIEDFGLCTGPIISGHVHTASTYKGDFHYTGSPIRWCFGEESAKGFLLLLHKPAERKYMIHFEEIHSFRYDTIYLDHMLKEDPKKIIDHIQSLKDQGIHFIRVKFTENDIPKLEFLRNYYNHRRDIKIETDFEQKRIQEEIQQLGTKYQKYDYLFDKSLSPVEVLVKYINQTEKDSYWTVDSLTQFITDIQKL